MNIFQRALNWFCRPWVEESIRSWRQANSDAKLLVWDKTQRRWKPKEPVKQKWEGETAIESIESTGPR